MDSNAFMSSSNSGQETSFTIHVPASCAFRRDQGREHRHASAGRGGGNHPTIDRRLWHPMILRVLDLEYVFHIGKFGCSNQQMDVERATPVGSRLDGLTSCFYRCLCGAAQQRYHSGRKCKDRWGINKNTCSSYSAARYVPGAQAMVGTNLTFLGSSLETSTRVDITQKRTFRKAYA